MIPESVLTTLLFTDIVGSSRLAAEVGDRAWRDLLARHHASVRRELASFRGQERDTAGDGFFATFDGPARAIRCAEAAIEAVRPLGIEIRVAHYPGRYPYRGVRAPRSEGRRRRAFDRRPRLRRGAVRRGTRFPNSQGSRRRLRN